MPAVGSGVGDEHGVLGEGVQEGLLLAVRDRPDERLQEPAMFAARTLAAQILPDPWEGVAEAAIGTADALGFMTW